MTKGVGDLHPVSYFNLLEGGSSENGQQFPFILDIELFTRSLSPLPTNRELLAGGLTSTSRCFIVDQYSLLRFAAQIAKTLVQPFLRVKDYVHSAYCCFPKGTIKCDVAQHSASLHLMPDPHIYCDTKHFSLLSPR